MLFFPKERMEKYFFTHCCCCFIIIFWFSLFPSNKYLNNWAIVIFFGVAMQCSPSFSTLLHRRQLGISTRINFSLNKSLVTFCFQFFFKIFFMSLSTLWSFFRLSSFRVNICLFTNFLYSRKCLRFSIKFDHRKERKAEKENSFMTCFSFRSKCLRRNQFCRRYQWSFCLSFQFFIIISWKWIIVFETSTLKKVCNFRKLK